VLSAAPQISATSTGAGKAYIFVKPASGWKTTSHFTAELTASDGNPGDAFGWSPALTSNRAVIGAVGANAAYIFSKPKSGWKTTSHFNAKLTPADGSKGAFGFSTAISGSTIVVGALGSPRNGGPGATFVFAP
jgi:FG-GAP repeat